MGSKIDILEARLEDCRIIWEWWNDPVTRKMMKKNDYVEWAEHCAWFEEVLKDANRILCVGLVGSQKLGNVRFDLQLDQIYEVSINLNPRFRGKGYGWQVLRASTDYLRKVRSVKKLFAMTKKVNIPAIKTFKKAGFVFVEPKCSYLGMENFLWESELYCELNYD